MDKINLKRIALATTGFLIIEAMSFLTFSSPSLNGVILAIIGAVIIAASIYRLEYGFLLLLSELFIGSMGHLFLFNLPGGQISVRMAIWSAFMAVFSVKFIVRAASKKRNDYIVSLKNFPDKKMFAFLAVFIIIALVNGFMRGHAFDTVFADFNSWIFFLLIIPAVTIYGDGEKKKIARLKNIFLAAALWMSLKTLVFLFIFTHNSAVAPEIYSWLRRTLNGEMTPTITGWPRIFIQGQIYSGIAFLLIFWNGLAGWEFKNFFGRKSLAGIFLAGFFLSTLVISFSRSFWVALIIAVIFSLVIVWRLYSFSKTLAAGIGLISSLIVSVVIIYAIGTFPYIYRTGNFSASFLNRVSNGNEAAVASRWSLLPILMNKITAEPFLGQGYGATVTYKSSDPRVLQTNPDGMYTTYAFEWGYLDLWLKLGLFGLIAYMLLLYRLIKNGIIRGFKTESGLFLGLSAGLVFLAVTNIFTPYLNHPLGIGIVILGSCLIRPNKIY